MLILAPIEARIIGRLHKEVKFDIVTQQVIVTNESPAWRKVSHRASSEIHR